MYVCNTENFGRYFPLMLLYLGVFTVAFVMFPIPDGLRGAKDISFPGKF